MAADGRGVAQRQIAVCGGAGRPCESGTGGVVSGLSANAVVFITDGMLFVSSGCFRGVRAVVCAAGLAALGIVCHARELPVSESWTKPFQETFGTATALEVWEARDVEPDRKAWVKAFTVTDAAQVRALVARLAFVDEGHRMCACLGSEQLKFYQGDQQIGMITFHHGTNLRWENGPWQGDGALAKDSARFLREWLAARGIDGPKREVEASRQRALAANSAERRWLTAMPESLKTFYPDGQMAFVMNDKGGQTLAYALAVEFPDPVERIRVLLG